MLAYNIDKALVMDNCDKITTIDEVTEQYNHQKEHNGGSYDRSFVSCSVVGRYNELKRRFDIYYKSITDDNEKEIAQGMCKCCAELKPKGNDLVTWEEFYSCMSKHGLEFDDVAKILIDIL